MGVLAEACEMHYSICKSDGDRNSQAENHNPTWGVTPTGDTGKSPEGDDDCV